MVRLKWENITWGASEILVYIFLLVIAIGCLIIFFNLFVGAGFFLLPPLARLFISALIQSLIMVSLIFVVSWLNTRRFWRLSQLGLVASQSFPWGMGLAGGLALLTVAWAYGTIVNMYVTDVPAQGLLKEFISYRSGVGVLVFGVIVGILAPVSEELVFRGFIYGGLRSRVGFLTAGLISSLGFAIVHLSFHWVLFVQILILGFGLAMIYEISRNLMAPIIAHSIYNLVIIALAFVSS